MGVRLEEGWVQGSKIEKFQERLESGVRNWENLCRWAYQLIGRINLQKFKFLQTNDEVIRKRKIAEKNLQHRK